jgi:hypothetical protein
MCWMSSIGRERIGAPGKSFRRPRLFLEPSSSDTLLVPGISGIELRFDCEVGELYELEERWKMAMATILNGFLVLSFL